MTPDQLLNLAAIYRQAAERVDVDRDRCACLAIDFARQKLHLPFFVTNQALHWFRAAFKPPKVTNYAPWFVGVMKEKQQRRVLALLTMEQIALGNAEVPGEEE